eukprot:297432_1
MIEQHVEMIFDEKYLRFPIPSGFRGINEKNMVFPTIPNEYYSEILSSKYKLVCHDNLSTKTIEVPVVFKDINHIQFLIPQHVMINSKVNYVSIYVQPQQCSKFILLKTFEISVNVYKDEMHELLTKISIFKGNISSKEFFDQIGFQWNKEWIATAKCNYSDVLYRPTVLGLEYLGIIRLFEELKITELRPEYIALLPRIEIISAFSYVFLRIKVDSKHIAMTNKDHDIVSECSYILHCQFSEKKEIELLINNQDELMFRTDELLKSMKLLVQNEKLFGTDQWIQLHTIDLSLFIEHNHYPKEFNNNIKFIEKANIISILCHTIHEKYRSQIVESTYTVMLNVKKTIIQPDEININNIYQFHDITNINFIIPFCEQANIVSIYLQPKGYVHFVLIKTFIRKNKTINNKHQRLNHQCDYLLKILKVWNHHILNPATFVKKIGFDINEKHILLIKNHAMLYDSTTLQCNVLHRLVHELHIDNLRVIHEFISSIKVDVKLYAGFGCIVFRITYDKNHIEHFQSSNFKIVEPYSDSIRQNDFTFDNNGRLLIFPDKVITFYSLFIRNKNLLGIDK